MSESFFPLLQLCLWMLYVGLWATCWLWSQRGIGPSGSWQCSSPAGGLRSKSECTASQMGPRAKAHKWVSVARCFGLRDRAAWSSPAWPWNPHLFSPACHIGWWFQVALCRKDRRSCGFPWWQPWLWRQVRGCTDLASDSPRTYQLGKHDSEPRWLHSDGGLSTLPLVHGYWLTWATCWLWHLIQGERGWLMWTLGLCISITMEALHATILHKGWVPKRLDTEGASWPSQPDLPSRCSRLLQGFHGLSLAQLLTINIVIPETTQPLVKIMGDFFFCHKQFWRNWY